MSTRLFAAEDLFVIVAGTTLLSNLTINLEKGRSLALVGPSGCGKTMLLRGLAMLHDGLSGKVLLDGRPPAEHGYPEYRRQVCYVSQSPTLLDETVLENLQRPFHYATSNGKFPTQRAKHLLKSVGITTGRLRQQAHSLSLGQQQRVCLVRALLINPSVLLLDEPTSSLDERNVGRVLRLLKEEQRNTGLSVVMVSHAVEAAREFADDSVDLKTHAEGHVRG